MAYSMKQEAFLYLLDDVEEMGGTHLPGLCSGSVIEYEHGKPAHTHACRKEFQLLMPYDNEDGSEGLATVCAEGDRVDLWPRLQPHAL